MAMFALSAILMLWPLMATGTRKDFYVRNTPPNLFCHSAKEWEYDPVVRECGKGLIDLLQAQFPWIPMGNSTSSNHHRTLDPTDPLDHVCTAFRYTMKCIRARLGGVEEGCLQYGFSGNYLEVTTTMSFLCDGRDRLAVMRSMKCLWDTRILTNVQFRSWKRCGKSILSQQSNAMKNILFFVSGLTKSPLGELVQKLQKSLYCVSNDSVNCFLTDVQDRCGDHAADMVGDYFVRFQTDLMKVWQLENVTPDIVCGERTFQSEYNNNVLEKDKRAEVLHVHPYRHQHRGEITGLETNHGRNLLLKFNDMLSKKGLCNIETVDLGFRVLLFSLFVSDVPVRFNLFHLAHGVTIFRPYSVPCHTGDHRAIAKRWTMWRNICPSVRSQVYPLTVLLDGCRLYDLFDSQFHYCEWEDILIGIYARAAAISRSSNTDHWLPGGSNYLLLDGMYEYYSVEQWAGYTRRALWVIRNSLDEVTLKCGGKMTSTLIDFYNKLEYSLFDSIIHRQSLNS